jgi:hypothetical protein
MDLEAIKAWLKENESNPDVAAFVQGLGTLNIDTVKGFLSSTLEGRSFLDKERDTHFNKALETWKGKNLEGLVDAKVKELYPDETPEMKEINKLKHQLAEKEAGEKRQALLNKALQVASEKKLPTKFVERFLGEDEDTTTANLTEFEAEMNSYIQSQVDARFQGSGYTPTPGGDTGGTNTTGESLAQMAHSANLRAN